MSADTIGMVLGTAFGTLAMQLAVRFVLLRFLSRKFAALFAGILMIAAGFYAGDMALVTLTVAAVTLLIQLAKEPPKEPS